MPSLLGPVRELAQQPTAHSHSLSTTIATAAAPFAAAAAPLMLLMAPLLIALLLLPDDTTPVSVKLREA